MLLEILSIKKRILVIISQWVNKQSPKFLQITHRDFFNLNCVQRDQ